VRFLKRLCRLPTGNRILRSGARRGLALSSKGEGRRAGREIFHWDIRIGTLKRGVEDSAKGKRRTQVSGVLMEIPRKKKISAYKETMIGFWAVSGTGPSSFY